MRRFVWTPLGIVLAALATVVALHLADLLIYLLLGG